MSGRAAAREGGRGREKKKGSKKRQKEIKRDRESSRQRGEEWAAIVGNIFTKICCIVSLVASADSGQ